MCMRIALCYMRAYNGSCEYRQWEYDKRMMILQCSTTWNTYIEELYSSLELSSRVVSSVLLCCCVGRLCYFCCDVGIRTYLFWRQWVWGFADAMNRMEITGTEWKTHTAYTCIQRATMKKGKSFSLLQDLCLWIHSECLQWLRWNTLNTLRAYWSSGDCVQRQRRIFHFN